MVKVWDQVKGFSNWDNNNVVILSLACTTLADGFVLLVTAPLFALSVPRSAGCLLVAAAAAAAIDAGWNVQTTVG